MFRSPLPAQRLAPVAGGLPDQRDSVLEFENRLVELPERQDWPAAGVGHGLAPVQVKVVALRVLLQRPQQRASKGVLVSLEHRYVRPAPHVHLLGFQGRHAVALEVCLQLLDAHFEPPPRQLPLLDLLARETSPGQRLPAPKRPLRRLQAPNRLPDGRLGSLALLLREPAMASGYVQLRRVVDLREHVHVQDGAEVLRQDRVPVRGGRRPEQDLEPHDLQREGQPGQNLGQGIGHALLPGPLHQQLRDGGAEPRPPAQQRQVQVHGHRPARDVDDADGGAHSLKRDHQRKDGGIVVILYQGDTDEEVANALHQLPRSKRHADPRIRVKALPLRLQVPEQVDMPLGAHVHRLQQLLHVVLVVGEALHPLAQVVGLLLGFGIRVF
mmetsp:Transcript_49450/g.155588  ORF Transcript_49450/g.155588 Transcript_49450/m.155588 type:complete len:383 (+) Transcript_49450:1327-2475(+)